MKRITIVGLCLVAGLTMSALVVASASAAPEYYVPNKKTGQLEVSTKKVRYTESGGPAKLLEGNVTVLCSANTGKGDIKGATATAKLVVTYTGCNAPSIAGDPSCGTKKGTSTIKTHDIKGQLVEASETEGGPVSVGNLLEGEKTAEIAHFSCGPKEEVKVNVKGHIIIRPAETTYATAAEAEGHASTSGRTFSEAKAHIAGCGGQKLLFVNGAAPCKYLEVEENGGLLEPSWSVSENDVTYKRAVVIVGVGVERTSAGFEVTDKVHLTSGKMWSAFEEPPKWWVGGKLLVGSEPIAEETNLTNPFKLAFSFKKGEGGSVAIVCTKEKIKNGMIEAPGSRSEEAEVFEGCEVEGQPQCSVGSTGTPGTITTNALKAKLEGMPGAEKLKFEPESGKPIAAFEINGGPSCAENKFAFKADGEMICNYKEVENEGLEHPLEFTATSGSKVEVEKTV